MASTGVMVERPPVIPVSDLPLHMEMTRGVVKEAGTAI